MIARYEVLGYDGIRKDTFNPPQPKEPDPVYIPTSSIPIPVGVEWRVPRFEPNAEAAVLIVTQDKGAASRLVWTVPPSQGEVLYDELFEAWLNKDVPSFISKMRARGWEVEHQVCSLIRMRDEVIND